MQNKNYSIHRLHDPQWVVWVICLLIISTTFYIDLHIPLGVACAIPYILAVLAASFLQPVWAMPGIVLICSFLTIIGIYGSPQPLVVPVWKVFTNRGLALFAVQKNPRPRQYLASIGNLFFRKFQRDFYARHLSGMRTGRYGKIQTRTWSTMRSIVSIDFDRFECLIFQKPQFPFQKKAFHIPPTK